MTLARHSPLALLLASALVLVAACGRSGQAAAGPGRTAPTPPTGTAPTPTGAAPAIRAAAVAGLGTVLVDGSGFTLYAFMPDHRSHPTCVGLCAVEWQPMELPGTATAAAAGPGVRAGLLGTARRADGAVQVTYAGWPLYRWTGDTAPGEATGEGLNNLGGLWYVISPAGRVVR